MQLEQPGGTRNKGSLNLFGLWFPVAVCGSVFSKPNDFFQEHNHESLHKSTEFCCNI